MNDVPNGAIPVLLIWKGKISLFGWENGRVAYWDADSFGKQKSRIR